MHLNSLASIIIFLSLSNAEFIPIRGVPPKDLDKYQPNEYGKWSCLTNPEIVLSIDQINDNYCDCPDGSDEPGTSACLNGVFYCENIGFKSHFIPAYKVDDGVCDYDVCCDGSDEVSGTCENKCTQMKTEHDLKVKCHNDLISEGLKLKDDILMNSLELKIRLENSIGDLSLQIKDLENKIEYLEKEKLKLDHDENDELINKNFNIIEDNVESISTNMLDSFESLNSYIVKLESLKSILKKMTNEYNHNFNDPAVKQAANDYLNFAASNEDNNINMKELINNFQNDFENTKSEISKIKAEILSIKSKKSSTPSQPSSTSSSISALMNILSIACKELVDSFLGIESHIVQIDSDDELSSFISSVSSTSEIDDKLNSLKIALNDLTLKLKTNESDLNKDYGPENMLRSLQDECVTTSIGDYKYKFCPTSILEQINIDNRGTKIGIFDEIKYSEHTKNYQLFFKNGERCWNGPVRSAIVDIVCGLELGVLSVTEPEKCIYHFKVSSPIGCFESDIL